MEYTITNTSGEPIYIGTDTGNTSINNITFSTGTVSHIEFDGIKWAEELSAVDRLFKLTDEVIKRATYSKVRKLS